VFEAPKNSKQNGHIKHAVEKRIANGHVREPGNQRHTSVDSASLAIRHRSDKKTDRERKSSKNDGSLELASGPNRQILSVTPLTRCKTDQE